MAKTILVVEDDPVVLKVLETRLINDGYAVLKARDANEAMVVATNQRPDLMVLDLNLINGDGFTGILDGFSLLAWMRYTLQDVEFPVVIHTSDPSPNLEWRAAEAGVSAVIHKGADLNELSKAVREALGQTEAEGVE